MSEGSLSHPHLYLPGKTGLPPVCPHLASPVPGAEEGAGGPAACLGLVAGPPCPLPDLSPSPLGTDCPADWRGGPRS